VDLQENRKLTYYKNLRITAETCDPKNKENIICETDTKKEADFLSKVSF